MPPITVSAAGADHTTISVAAVPGDTILVHKGVHDENVVIDKPLTLGTQNSRGATSRGVRAGAEFGAVTLAAGLTGVTLHGFVIEGISGNGAIENVGVYLTGAPAGHLIDDNENVTRGDHGFASEISATPTGLAIVGNDVTGQTFQGPQPGGVGIGTQLRLLCPDRHQRLGQRHP